MSSAEELKLKSSEILERNKKLAIDGGYGKIKGETFRISNMGNETEASMSHLLTCMDEVLPHHLPS